MLEHLPHYQCFQLSKPFPFVQNVELARPKANAMNLIFFKELLHIFRVIALDSEVRVAIISSSIPKFFTAGLDLGEVNIEFDGARGDPAREALKFLTIGPIKMMQESISAIETCNKPVICVIQSFCIGGGIDLATACDIRMCSKDVIFSVREVVVGLAADLGSLQRLPKLVGNQSWVRDICLTGRDFGWQEALEQGFVSYVGDSQRQVLDKALEMAVLIASRSPVATLGTKHILIHARDHSVQDGLDYTAIWNSIMLNTPDVMESGKAILTKSKPSFAKL